MGLLPWLCAASRRFKISYALGLRTFPKFAVRHGSKPWTLAAIYMNSPLIVIESWKMSSWNAQ